MALTHRFKRGLQELKPNRDNGSRDGHRPMPQAIPIHEPTASDAMKEE